MSGRTDDDPERRPALVVSHRARLRPPGRAATPPRLWRTRDARARAGPNRGRGEVIELADGTRLVLRLDSQPPGPATGDSLLGDLVSAMSAQV